MNFYLGRFKANGKVCFGAIEEEQVYDLSLSSMWRQEKLSTPNNPIDILASDRHIKQVATFIKKLKNSDTKLGVFNLSDIKLLPPVIPEQIIGIGYNYVDHIKMSKAEIPECPIIFLKPFSII